MIATTKIATDLIYCDGCHHFYCFVNQVQDATNPSYVAIKDRNDTGNGEAEYMYVKLLHFHLEHSILFDSPVNETINLIYKKNQNQTNKNKKPSQLPDHTII